MGIASGLAPITAENAFAESGCLSGELTIGLVPMTDAAQVESTPTEAVTQSIVAVAGGLTLITAENMPEETVDLNGEDSKHPEGRNRRTDQNRRRSQDRRNRKRMKQLCAGIEATHEAEGAKTRGAAASSIEFAHEPDPLYPAVDGDAKERALEDNDSLAHEAANTEAICLSVGMSISADEVLQISENAADIKVGNVFAGLVSTNWMGIASGFRAHHS